MQDCSIHVCTVSIVWYIVGAQQCLLNNWMGVEGRVEIQVTPNKMFSYLEWKTSIGMTSNGGLHEKSDRPFNCF